MLAAVDYVLAYSTVGGLGRGIGLTVALCFVVGRGVYRHFKSRRRDARDPFGRRRDG